MKAYVTIKGLLMEKISQTITPHDTAKAPYEQNLLKLHQNGLDKLLSVEVIDKKEFEGFQPNTNVTVNCILSAYSYNGRLVETIKALPKTA